MPATEAGAQRKAAAMDTEYTDADFLADIAGQFRLVWGNRPLLPSERHDQPSVWRRYGIWHVVRSGYAESIAAMVAFDLTPDPDEIRAYRLITARMHAISMQAARRAR